MWIEIDLVPGVNTPTELAVVRAYCYETSFDRTKGLLVASRWIDDRCIPYLGAVKAERLYLKENPLMKGYPYGTRI